MVPKIINTSLILGLLYSSYTDYRTNRIYNIVTIPLIGFGFAANSIYYGFTGLVSSLLGCLLSSAPLFIAFLLGGLGGGDVKLMAAVGALKGIDFGILALFFTVTVGALWALVLLAKHGELGSLIQRLVTGRLTDCSSKLTLPYGIAITCGSLLALGVSWL
ncbi:MAG: A24 family peptidase [Limnochordia bacterium]|jgi:prepilin peptidase CpaA|nr:A24 family peptidase [Limnochordia bacterium]MDD2629110.1 A24 family peptidase [Limnochordia bacterium]MDD4517288.1 A24 family peptidase [Limnochordia bacterium]